MEVKEMRSKVLAFLAGFGSVFLINEAFATQPYNIDIQDYEKTVIKRTPYNVEVCSERRVSGDKTGDAVMGAIIGGIIGNNVTKNMPDGGTAGAIIGGLLGHQNSDAKGGTQRRCNTEIRYNEEVRTIYSHSTVSFWYNGKKYNLKFKK